MNKSDPSGTSRRLQQSALLMGVTGGEEGSKQPVAASCVNYESKLAWLLTYKKDTYDNFWSAGKGYNASFKKITYKGCPLTRAPLQDGVVVAARQLGGLKGGTQLLRREQHLTLKVLQLGRQGLREDVLKQACGLLILWQRDLAPRKRREKPGPALIAGALSKQLRQRCLRRNL